MTVCIANIGPRERRTRMVGGMLAIALGLGVLALLVVYDAPRVSRALLLVPFWSGAIGVLQAREKT